MRYNPSTDRAIYTIDEIAAQCRAAIMKAPAADPSRASYDELLEFARWEDDVLIAA